MEGFKANPKMKSQLPCYKEGGYISKPATKMKSQPVAEEKAVTKSKSSSAAIKEKSAPVEVKLKKGGRSKKEKGTIKKFKAGGKNVKKYEDGGFTGPLENTVSTPTTTTGANTNTASTSAPATTNSTMSTLPQGNNPNAQAFGNANQNASFMGGNAGGPNANALANANQNASFMKPPINYATGTQNTGVNMQPQTMPGAMGTSGNINLNQFENQNKLAAGQNSAMPNQQAFTNANSNAFFMPPALPIYDFGGGIVTGFNQTPVAPAGSTYPAEYTNGTQPTYPTYQPNTSIGSLSSLLPGSSLIPPTGTQDYSGLQVDPASSFSNLTNTLQGKK